MIPSQIKTCGKLTGQKGSTLTGLMIGLLVGLLTLAAMYSIFSQNQSVDKFVRDNNFDAQQKIRSLTTLIQMHIVLSGYVEPPINQAVTSSYRFIELGNNDPLSGENNILLEDDIIESDILTYRFKASDGETFRDCADALVSNKAVSTNALTVKFDESTTGRKYPYGLFCNSVELLNGVQSMDILYAEDLNGDRSVNRFLAANASGLDFSRVVGLRITFDIITSQTENNFATKPVSISISLRNSRLSS